MNKFKKYHGLWKLFPYYDIECNSKDLPDLCTHSPWLQDANTAPIHTVTWTANPFSKFLHPVRFQLPHLSKEIDRDIRTTMQWRQSDYNCLTNCTYKLIHCGSLFKWTSHAYFVELRTVSKIDRPETISLGDCLNSRSNRNLCQKLWPQSPNHTLISMTIFWPVWTAQSTWNPQYGSLTV